jgi:hypothetical protein
LDCRFSRARIGFPSFNILYPDSERFVFGRVYNVPSPTLPFTHIHPSLSLLRLHLLLFIYISSSSPTVHTALLRLPLYFFPPHTPYLVYIYTSSLLIHLTSSTHLVYAPRLRTSSTHLVNAPRHRLHLVIAFTSSTHLVYAPRLRTSSSPFSMDIHASVISKVSPNDYLC